MTNCSRWKIISFCFAVHECSYDSTDICRKGLHRQNANVQTDKNGALLHMHLSGIHTRMNSVIKHLLSPVTFSPFLQKLFERCDSLKQKGPVCVFWANFPLHRWHRLVCFSFIFNGGPPLFAPSLPTLASVTALSSSGGSPDGEGKHLNAEATFHSAHFSVSRVHYRPCTGCREVCTIIRLRLNLDLLEVCA